MEFGETTSENNPLCLLSSPSVPGNSASVWIYLRASFDLLLPRREKTDEMEEAAAKWKEKFIPHIGLAR